MSGGRPPKPAAVTASHDVFTAAECSAVMAKVKGRDTGPELRVRKLLTRLGLRYRLHRRDLPGSPDVAFPSRKVALFVHGCFWHGHACARGARKPKTNADYWSAKIARNAARDAWAQAALAAEGWRSLTVWECELKDEAALSARLSAELEPAASAASTAA